ncbi:DUF2786 domain-containing protein [Amycolatopsis minnesotensis]|uniref:DUF2786 domain-containing protein n=1 Tax=Amycolatopsis minnesotensis TaxID=337894 RepID=A0ABN2RPW7_9PSEU
MPEEDALLARVRKLLAKAEDPAVTEAEAEAYNTKAAELIARYGIDQAMLAARAEFADEVTSMRIDVENPYSRDKAQLVTCIAEPLRCRTVLARASQRVHWVTVFGFRSDLLRIELLFTSLLLQAGTQLGRASGGGTAQSVAAYRRSWLQGFALAVFHRLKGAEEKAVAEHDGGSGSAELVLRDRKAVVEAAYQEEFGALRMARRRRLTGSGFSDGRAAGERADLGTTGVTGKRGGLLNR